MDPRYLDQARIPLHGGLRQMNEIGQSEVYKTRSLYDLINLLHLSNPKINKKDLLLQMLQRDLDQDLNKGEFSKGWGMNQLEMQQRKQHGAPADMPFTPGSLWM